MEIRRLSLCLAFLLVAVISQCSEARHSKHKRDTTNDDDDLFMSDGTDTEQNDAENAEYRDSPDETTNQATIITRPTKYNVTVGRNVRLECKIDSNDAVVYWRTGDVELVVAGFVPNNTDKYKFDPHTKDLIINDLVPQDSGIYKCTVMQTVPVFIEHTLVVSELPKVINITASDNGRPQEGSDLLLTCDVTGSPFPKIIWSKDGGEGNGQLSEKDGEFGRNSVFIKKVTKAHSGTYYCYAFNGVGGDQKGIVVAVLGTPHIYLPRTVVNSAVNVEATLQCSVHEEPPPPNQKFQVPPCIKITWYRNGQVITSSNKTIISTLVNHSNLTVIPESDDDFGVYTCQAECTVGKHSRSIELVQRPVIEALEADGDKLAWTIHSHQQLERIEVQLKNRNKDEEWKVFSVPIPETRTHLYEISYPVDQSQLTAGSYEAVVKVQNNHGWSDPENVDVNIAEQQPMIQGASVYRGNNADVSRPATVLLSTVLMYLLVRML